MKVAKGIGVLLVVVLFGLVGCSAATGSQETDEPQVTQEPQDTGAAATTEPTATAGHDMGMGGATEEGTSEMAPFDAMFIDSMIPHHQMAIDMAEQALNEAEHEELRTMAQEIIDAQQQEIDQMSQWRTEWYPDLAPTEGMEMPMAMEDMELSDDTSIPFDLRFIDAMIPHHESAVVMAQEAIEKAEHEEIRQLAQEIIDAQQAEIDQLQQWREEWYPDAPEA